MYTVTVVLSRYDANTTPTMMHISVSIMSSCDANMHLTIIVPMPRMPFFVGLNGTSSHGGNTSSTAPWRGDTSASRLFLVLLCDDRPKNSSGGDASDSVGGILVQTHTKKDASNAIRATLRQAGK